MQGMSERFALVAAIALATVAAIVVVSTSVLGQSAPVDLVESKLSQHLMSQFSREGVEMKAKDGIFNTEGETKSSGYHAWTGDDSSTFDQLKDAGSRPVDEAESGIHSAIARDSEHHKSWYGKWGASSSERAASKWQTTLQSMQAKAEARRKAEDQKYFSGVYKAFGKKAGERMMEAFEGKKVKGLNKIKIDENALAARKQAIAHNGVLPESKESKELQHKAHTKAAHQAVMAKHSAHAAQVAANMMDAHTAPAKDTAAAPVKKDAPAKEVKPKVEILKHPGVIADARKIKELVHEFKHAHGQKKKVLKARVMQLKEEIVNDFSTVTAFGARAKTALQRAEAKGKAAAHGDSHRHRSDSDSDGWH